MGLYGVGVLGTGLLMSSPDGVLNYAPRVVAPLVFFTWVYLEITRPRDVAWFLTAAFPLGVFMWISFAYSPFAPETALDYGGREFVGFFGGGSEMGAFLLAVLPLFVLLSTHARGWRKGLFGISLIGDLLFIVLTLKRFA